MCLLVSPCIVFSSSFPELSPSPLRGWTTFCAHLGPCVSGTCKGSVRHGPSELPAAPRQAAPDVGNQPPCPPRTRASVQDSAWQPHACAHAFPKNTGTVR